MRKVPLTSRFAALELLAAGGSAAYYFTEQLTWCGGSAVVARLPCGVCTAWASAVRRRAPLTSRRRSAADDRWFAAMHVCWSTEWGLVMHGRCSCRVG